MPQSLPLPSVAVDRRGRTMVLSIAGEIDAATVPFLQMEMNAALGDAGRWVAMDLRDVTFLGAAGLHLLADVDRRVRGSHGRLDVVCPRAIHRRMFVITGLDQRLHLHADLDSALIGNGRSAATQ